MKPETLTANEPNKSEWETLRTFHYPFAKNAQGAKKAMARIIPNKFFKKILISGHSRN